MNIKDSLDVCKVEIGTHWPPIRFNLIRRNCEIGDKTYKYFSHGGWFMIIFGLLPVVWSTCPFTWQIGLAIGTLLALALNIITYFLFDKKIKRLVDNISNTQSKNDSNENSSADVVIYPEESYCYALWNANLLVANHNGKQYVMISETNEPLQKEINKAGAQNKYVVYSKPLGAIMQNIKASGTAGIALVVEDKIQIVSSEELNKMTVPDYLETKLKSKSKIYVLKVKESTSYITVDKKILAALDYQDAVHMLDNIKSQGVYDVAIEEIKPLRLMDLLRNNEGLSISGANYVNDYDKSSDEVIQILRKFC